MKYSILKVINGNFFVHSEGITTLDNARAQYHGVCQTLWNAPDVNTASVMIANEKLECMEGYREIITRTPVEQLT